MYQLVWTMQTARARDIQPPAGLPSLDAPPQLDALGDTRPHLSADEQKLVEMWQAGESRPAIAHAFTLSPDGVDYRVKGLRAKGVDMPAKRKGRRRSNETS